MTKIRFEIPVNTVGHPEYSGLSVYDILGKEVATLINERLQPGTYDVTFDGSKLNSGTYFYRIDISGKTSKFSETKKMILTK
jgi:hypothetical protein